MKNPIIDDDCQIDDNLTNMMKALQVDEMRENSTPYEFVPDKLQYPN